MARIKAKRNEHVVTPLHNRCHYLVSNCNFVCYMPQKLPNKLYICNGWNHTFCLKYVSWAMTFCLIKAIFSSNTNLTQLLIGFLHTMNMNWTFCCITYNPCNHMSYESKNIWRVFYIVCYLLESKIEIFISPH
jgi:hypothetical protein